MCNNEQTTQDILPEDVQKYFSSVLKFCFMAEFIFSNYSRTAFHGFMDKAPSEHVQFYTLWKNTKLDAKKFQKKIRKEYSNRINIHRNKRK